jgi:hypothetical protein
MKTLAGLSGCLILLLLTGGALAATPQQGEARGQGASALVAPEPPAWQDRRELGGSVAGEAFEADEVRRIVADLRQDASADEVELALYDLLPQLYRATNQDMAVVGEAVEGLRQQPGAVKAITRHYQTLPAEAFEKRLMVIGILGEMRRPDSASQLREVVWAPLPPAESTAEKLSQRDLEEMIQVKAVQGLAYLATPAADQAVLEVIANHEALHVRASAIDAYMWNHGDSRQTADQLYRLLPAELHPYVERPRFHRDMDPAEFTRRLAAWRERWHPRPAKSPAANPQGGEP